MKERQLTVRLEEELADQLDALARKTGLTRATIVRAALKDYLHNRGGEPERPVDLVRDLLGGASLAAEGGETREEMIQRIRRHNARPS